MDKMRVRKPIRLSGYDYSQEGLYFITICVKDKHELLGRIDVGATFCRPQLSDIGKIVENKIMGLACIYEYVLVDKYVIMPNHIHMIIKINGRQNAAPTISRIIGQWKRDVSIKVGFSIWQKSFHDHIIRDEDNYLRIWKYIDENPTLWTKDRYYSK